MNTTDMTVVARILCKSNYDNQRFQEFAQTLGISWDSSDCLTIRNVDRWYLMITEPRPNTFVLSWATLYDFAAEIAPLFRAEVFTQDSNAWSQIVQNHRQRQSGMDRTKSTVQNKPQTNVILPEEFVATTIPGYFWNTKTKQLFTAKSGVLRRLKYQPPNHWNQFTNGYRVCHNGKRKWLLLEYLNTLTPKASIYPVEFVTTKSSNNDDVAVALNGLPSGTKVRVIIEG